jgi:putative two-component system response regulator
VEKAFEVIRSDSGTHFDPRIVEAFFDIKETILKIKDRWDIQEPILSVQENFGIE